MRLEDALPKTSLTRCCGKDPDKEKIHRLIKSMNPKSRQLYIKDPLTQFMINMFIIPSLGDFLVKTTLLTALLVNVHTILNIIRAGKGLNTLENLLF